MPNDKKEFPKEKSGLHPRNKHRERYNFEMLIGSYPELAPFVHLNKYNNESIDFANARAVLSLNKALLKHHYGIESWSIPTGYLCPPIPGRADYIHRIAELLGNSSGDKIPVGNQIKCLDIGVGANCIYPIIGHIEYEWSFVGSDIEPEAIQSASKIIEANSSLKNNVEIRIQANSNDIFRGIIRPNELFDLTICNPPFHASSDEAQKGNLRKLSNLNDKRMARTSLNFGGLNNELWCKGGEEAFVHNTILQSKQFAASCFWFSTLISKQSNLRSVYSTLKKSEAIEVKTIPMSHGNKISRIVAWTFLSQEQQQNWIQARWR